MNYVELKFSIPTGHPRQALVLIELGRIEIRQAYGEYPALASVLIELCRIEMERTESMSAKIVCLN